MTRSVLGAMLLLVTLPVVLASAKGPSVGKLQKRLARALNQEDEATAQAVIEKLGETNKLAAAKSIVQATSRFPHLQLFPTARKALIGMTAAHSWICTRSRKSKQWLERYLLLEVCAGIKTDEAAKAVRAGAEDTHPTILEALVPHLAAQRKKESVDALIAVLDQCEQRRFADAEMAAHKALKSMTGERFRTADDWRLWWEQVRDRFDLSKARKLDPDKQRSGTSVRDRIENRNESRYLERLKQGDVIVLKGKFDMVEKVLTELKIPHTVVERTQALQLKPSQVVIVNCSDKPPAPETIAQLTGFVARGGYLFTSDWEMHNVLTKSFPKTVTVQKQIAGHDGVGIAPAPQAFGHPYLRDVFPSKNPYKTAAGLKWKVDAASDLQGPLRPGITPLVFSRDLFKLHKNGVVALTFRYDGRIVPPRLARKPKRKRRTLTGSKRGRTTEVPPEWRGGSVLHVLGHFNAQSDPKGDGYALQQLLANFIVEKQKQRAFKRVRKKKR